MSAENLWGEIPSTGTLKTPIAILREQAGVLGAMTNNVLEGDASIGRKGTRFQLTLVIVAPALDNYRMAILGVEHDMTLYPLTITDFIGAYPRTDIEEVMGVTHEIRCKDEGEFKSELRTILSSDPVHRIIQSLLSQSQAA